jgi:hypothetical protein
MNKRRKRFGKRVEKVEDQIQHIVSEEVLKSCARGLTKHIEREKDIYKRERLRVIREEIKLLTRTVYF